jgi:ABC-type sugar transport system ATPase subunit
MSHVVLREIRKNYGSLEVIHGINLSIDKGEFIVFVGPSGCGKSTLLRMIAGLEQITAGDLLIGGVVVNDQPSAKRGISMVFQSYALYPHMSVFDNMAFGLKLSKTPKDEIDRRVRNAAAILKIEDYLDRMPKALSGGQRQRVAIGRAIVRDPQVFLFDEPLSNLDAALRVQTRIEIAKLHDTLGSTMIYVTHDQVEAMTLADRIVVLNGGNVEQVGTPLDLYNKPDNLFVAQFISSPKMNILDISNSGSDKASITLPGGRIVHFADNRDMTLARKLGIRPEHLVLANEQTAALAGTVDVVEHLGEYALAYMILDGNIHVTVKIEGAPQINKGDLLYLGFDIEKAHVFDGDGLAIR